MEEDKNRHDLATLDMVNLRFLRFFGVVLPRNDFWLRRHILWRIRWRYSRSLQFYWRVLLCNVLFIFSALRHKLSLDFSLFSPFSYVELTFVIAAIRSSENGWRHENHTGILGRPILRTWIWLSGCVSSFGRH